ncbi:MAG: hypothetical protein ABH812_01320 [bacterium]
MLICLFSNLFFLASDTQAFDSTSLNNKFGIHLAVAEREDLIKAAELINSSGGQWGYVTLVIQENDRDTKKWQVIFDQMRSLKLIPIVRLATQPQGNVWKTPSVDDIGGWLDFLQSLNWVVKDRYIVLFNEPNHASEWGGRVDPESYAKIAYGFAKRLKEKDKNYFVMLAGLDASAPSSLPNYEDEETFLTKMFKSEIRNPKTETNLNFKNLNFENCLEFRISCFEFLIDGLASHSYPNPGFQGGPYDKGRGTVSTYDWELSYLYGLGVQKNLPVFITETGWPHSENISTQNNNFPSSSVVGQNIKAVYENIWMNDQRVRAVTPFVLNYQTEPFLNFSWKKQGSEDFYDQFNEVKNINKIKGDPEQIIKASINIDLPSKILVSSNYEFKGNIKNTGQSIINSANGYKLEIEDLNHRIKSYFFSNIDEIVPNNEGAIDLFMKTSEDEGKETFSISLYKNNQKISEKKWKVIFEPLPELEFKVNLFPKLDNSVSDIEIQIFDKDEKLVFKKSGITAYKGKAKIENIKNIYLGGRYRVVLIAPYYLPRQNYMEFNGNKNNIKFKFLIPLDLNQDGKFGMQDFWSLIKKPGLFSLFKF